jgi:ribonuclease J
LPTKLTFYGGVNEVVAATRSFLMTTIQAYCLTLARVFSRTAKYFEEYLSPRIANGIVDFIEMGLIPDVEGIYREDLLEMWQGICLG